jgi:hypothetical protein
LIHIISKKKKQIKDYFQTSNSGLNMKKKTSINEALKFDATRSKDMHVLVAELLAAGEICCSLGRGAEH